VKHVVISALALVLVSGCGAPRDPGPDSRPATVDDLLEADRAFGRATAERRLEGWMSFFEDDSARLLPGQVVRGLGEIRALDAELFDDPTLSLEWEPLDGGLFRDLDHGFTTGRYEVVRAEAGGSSPEPEVVSRGTYVTIWRRGESGWKVILDTGSPDPPAQGGGAE
jgi:ketosteroid isomerase-like protein